MKHKKVFLISGICLAVAVLAVVILLAIFASRESDDPSETTDTNQSDVLSESLVDTQSQDNPITQATENIQDSNSPTKPIDLSSVVGHTQNLPSTAGFVYEVSQATFSDPLSQSFLEKSTLTVISIDKETQSAQVEFYVPDLDKIMREHLPTDTSADFEILFAQYESAINQAISSASASDMISTTVQCPIITKDTQPYISIIDAPIFNYQSILAEILLEMLQESEVAP